MSESIKLYTDGAAKGNPGRGGYGTVLKFKGEEKELSQGFRMTTNNRMELLAVIAGLESLKSNAHPVEIYSDSKYVVDSVEKKWVFGWKQKGFKGKKNQDLWERYLPLHGKFQPKFHWIKGHSGHPENERCDQLAVWAAEQNKHEIDVGYETSQKTFKLISCRLFD
jgi:ribonuclease HI